MLHTKGLMDKTKTILNQVSDMYMAANPNFFYSQSVFFPVYICTDFPEPFISIYHIQVDQIDIRIMEQDGESDSTTSRACFFFKS